MESLALVLPQPNFPMEDESHNLHISVVDPIHLHYCNVTSSFILVICPLLMDIRNGRVSYQPSATQQDPPRPSANTVASYTCDNGCSLMGPAMRTCENNGWMPPEDTNPTTCEYSTIFDAVHWGYG